MYVHGKRYQVHFETEISKRMLLLRRIPVIFLKFWMESYHKMGNCVSIHDNEVPRSGIIGFMNICGTAHAPFFINRYYPVHPQQMYKYDRMWTLNLKDIKSKWICLFLLCHVHMRIKTEARRSQLMYLWCTCHSRWPPCSHFFPDYVKKPKAPHTWEK